MFLGENPFLAKKFVVFIQIAVERKRNTLEKNVFIQKIGNDYIFQKIIEKNCLLFLGVKG